MLSVEVTPTNTHIYIYTNNVSNDLSLEKIQNFDETTTQI